MKKLREVERVSGMTRERFFSDYFRRRPVVMEDKIRHWEAVGLWSPEYFRERYGDVMVRVDRYDPDSERSYLEQHLDYVHTQIPFRDFIDSLAQERQLWTIREDNELMVKLPELVEQLDRFRPFGHETQAEKDRYCAIWFSSQGDMTGLHVDLVEGQLFHIYGQKRFLFFAPDQTPYLYEEPPDRFEAPDLKDRIDALDLETFRELIRWGGATPLRPDYARHPLLKHAEYWECVVTPGDMLYVPEGWWHTTQSLTPCISVTRGVYEPEFLRPV